MRIVLAIFLLVMSTRCAAAEPPEVEVRFVRKVFDNGEHNAFTDMIRFGDHYYLTFRSCPDGHMVHPSSSIRILRSPDLHRWEPVHQFSVPLRDTRDPHFLDFRGRLFVYTGTWYCGETSPAAGQYDLNQHLGYAVHSPDGQQWSSPEMLEGTFGHYIWRASSLGDRAYLCGRRKHQFDVRPKGEGPEVESAMLVSDDGLVWKKLALFQETNGDETAFQFETDGSLLAVARRGRGKAELLRSQVPFHTWERKDLDRYIGGPLLARWGDRWVVGGRKMTLDGPRTSLCWLVDDELVEFAELPSGGDNSYPGLVVESPSKAVVSWYSSHEVDEVGKTITAIYLAELHVVEQSIDRQRIEFESRFDGTRQAAYLAVPPGVEPIATASAAQPTRPVVISLHSWSADMEQRQIELERLVNARGWFCLQPNFRGVNQTPLACGSEAAQLDIIDALEWLMKNYPVDHRNIFLTGTSGGGHMTMMMAANFPDRWTAASAWVGISDLAAWYEKHQNDKYGEMMRQCCGGAPADSATVAAEFRKRSPLVYLSGAKEVALDIAAGIHDGHSGSVPVRHSLDAFNAIAEALGEPTVGETEIQQLSLDNGRLARPLQGDVGYDPSFDRQHYLRRVAGKSRVTIFEGGHEGIATAAMAWFERHFQR